MHLARKAFWDALVKGQGRAVLHAREYGIEDRCDLMLEACVHNQTYDPQCESRREAWLLSLIDGSPCYRDIRTAVLAALETETDNWDLRHLCGLAKEIAAKGDVEARRVLERRVREIAATNLPDDEFGAREWVELQGVEGVLDLARIYGQRLLANPDDNVNSWYFKVGEPETQQYRQALRQHAQTEPPIQAYWEYLEKVSRLYLPPAVTDEEKERRKAESRQRVREKYPLEKILSDAANGQGRGSGYYANFGYHATAEELERVYAALLSEEKEATLVRLLWVFRRIPLPRLHPQFFDWATGPADELRAAAIAALAKTTDTRVHELARQKLSTGALLGADNEVLDLFLHNYGNGDAELICQSLASMQPDADDAHSLAMGVIDLAEEHVDRDLHHALLWAYENTPCSICRHRAVVQLDKLGLLPDNLVRECLYDADEDTRELARKHGTS